MKQKYVGFIGTVLVLLFGAIGWAKATTISEIRSKGRIESEEVVFDSRDLELLLNAIEEGKQNAYNEGFEAGKSSASMKDIIKSYDAISVTNVSWGAGTHTLSEGLLFAKGSFGNWTSNWGGRVADITVSQNLYDPDGNLLASFCNGTWAGDYCRGHGFPQQLIYVPEGSQLVISYRVVHDNGASASVSGTMIYIN